MEMPEPDKAIVRYDEIGIKSNQVRKKMERKLSTNIENILRDRDIDGRAKRAWSRIIIETENPEKAAEAVADVPGVSSTSAVIETPAEKNEIQEKVLELAEEKYDGGSFAMNVRRAGEKDVHSFTSQDLEREIGQAVMDQVEGVEPEVDLDDPGIEFQVDCRQDKAYVFMDKKRGPGGLPVGTQGKLVGLLSGGYDSPVALWRAMKRGAEIVPVYIDLGEYGGPDHRARVMDIADTLQSYAPNRDMRVRRIPAGEFIEELMDKTGDTRMLHYRRFMYRVAEIIAEEEGCKGIVTGEAIGQKSSQTLSNLKVASKAVDTPIHRPLISMDKKDIIEEAKDIGTHKGSKIPAGCVDIAPEYPETHADIEKVRENEPEKLFEWGEEAARNIVIED